ncbi:MAG: hypothetical protein KC619_02640 [Myxococcales bacterium]|nr:hypothetical protein [Myxococcales bacterium]
MLVLVQHLIRNGKWDRHRLTELGKVLARFEAQPGRFLADPRWRAEAERIARLKREVSEAIGEVRACAHCAKGCGGTSGVFEGGRCCGTNTQEVFAPPEVRVIKLAGVAPPTEPAADGDPHAGCIFRGSRGCSLAPEARPAKCLVYVCHELRHELEGRDDDARGERFERIQALRRELDEAQARLEAATS